MTVNSTTKRGLTLAQKIALLPASIPDCVLDLLEDFAQPEVLAAKSKGVAAFKPDYYEKNRTQLENSLRAFRELGAVTQVEAGPLQRQYPGAFIVKLIFERGVRGLGFVVLQGTARTGVIAALVVQDDGFSEDFLKEKVVAYYKK